MTLIVFSLNVKWKKYTLLFIVPNEEKKKKGCFHLRDVKDVGGFYITADVGRFTPCKLGMLMMFKMF